MKIFGTYCADEQELTKILDNIVADVLKLLVTNNITIATAESCTGGLLAEKITAISGASEVFELGIVAYSERIKSLQLDIDVDLFNKFSVYSPQVALAMAKGVQKKAPATIGVGITGIAGPFDVSNTQKMGDVFISVAFERENFVKNAPANLKLADFYSDLTRTKVRLLSAIYAFDLVKNIVLDYLKG